MIYANSHRGDYPRHVAPLTTCLVKYLGLDSTDLYFHRVRIVVPNVSLMFRNQLHGHGFTAKNGSF